MFECGVDSGRGGVSRRTPIRVLILEKRLSCFLLGYPAMAVAAFICLGVHCMIKGAGICRAVRVVAWLTLEIRRSCFIRARFRNSERVPAVRVGRLFARGVGNHEDYCLRRPVGTWFILRDLACGPKLWMGLDPRTSGAWIDVNGIRVCDEANASFNCGIRIDEFCCESV